MGGGKNDFIKRFYLIFKSCAKVFSVYFRFSLCYRLYPKRQINQGVLSKYSYGHLIIFHKNLQKVYP